MNESITITNAARVAGHTPGPWATDIEGAAETIAMDGSYDNDTFRVALEHIANDGLTAIQARKAAARAIAIEASDSRIGAACVYINHGSGKGGQICAFPHDPEDGLDITDAETKANAHLMTLAPDLWKFVVRLAETCASTKCSTAGDGNAMLAAIAKDARAILDAI